VSDFLCLWMTSLRNAAVDFRSTPCTAQLYVDQPVARTVMAENFVPICVFSQRPKSHGRASGAGKGKIAS